MKRYRAIAASSAFLGLMLLKMAFPGVAEKMSGKLHTAMGDETEYIEAFRDLGKRLSLSRSAPTPSPPQLQPSAAPAAETKQISFYVEEGSALGETFDPLPEEAAETPSAVAAFLQSQEAFSSYELPENVAYAYVALPFDYVSPVAGYESSGFGYRLHPILHTVRFHFGTDFAANAGERIVAFADGTVSFAGSDDSFGRHLKIDHGNGWVSHYCHCSKLYVSEGQRVTRGETVALVGATGLATGPHLHFELSRDGVFLNPEYYLNV